MHCCAFTILLNAFNSIINVFFLNVDLHNDFILVASDTNYKTLDRLKNSVGLFWYFLVMVLFINFGLISFN